MKRFLITLAAVLLLSASGAGLAGAQNGQPYPAAPSDAQGQPSQDSNTSPSPQLQQGPPMEIPAPGTASAGQTPPPPAGQQSAQIQPGVARLSYIHGDVSQQRGDNGQWVASTLNTPVEPGDRVTTGQGARAELQLDYADVLRLSSDVTANVVALTRNNIQVQVGQGLTTYSVLKGSEAQSEIDTPNAAVRPLGQGEFRILVNSNAETQVVVREGSAEISTPQGTTRVDRGQMITVAGTDNPQYKTDPASGRDEWDSWNNDRDKRITNAESWRHTDRYYTGAEDMDAYGSWSEVPDYGPVWTPTVDPGWAPYRDGRWVWEPYYGWTWVSYEPWGWAPYHYGRWFVYGGNWVWWPGPVVAYPSYYPIWAPAYVSFFGFGGGGWGVSFGFGFGGWGRIGWLPCGPGDWFHPWYGGWGGRYGVVGFSEVGRFHEGFSPLGHFGHFSNFDEAFRNERVRGGFSSMGGNEFGHGAVSMHQERFSEAGLRQASVMTGRMPVNPSRESFSPSNRAANPSTVREGSFGSQRFYSSHSGFEGNRSAAFSNGRGFENNAGRGSFERPSSTFTPNRGGGAQPGWHSFTPPSSAATNRGEQGFANGNGRGSFRSPDSQHEFHSPNTSRGGYLGSSNNSYNRPPLNMRQPIVTPRGGYSGGYGSRGGGTGAYSAPRSYSVPQGGGHRGGNSGGGYRGGSGGPRGGGGSSRGGGGGHGGHSR